MDLPCVSKTQGGFEGTRSKKNHQTSCLCLQPSFACPNPTTTAGAKCTACARARGSSSLSCVTMRVLVGFNSQLLIISGFTPSFFTVHICCRDLCCSRCTYLIQAMHMACTAAQETVGQSRVWMLCAVSSHATAASRELTEGGEREAQSPRCVQTRSSTVDIHRPSMRCGHGVCEKRFSKICYEMGGHK